MYASFALAKSMNPWFNTTPMKIIKASEIDTIETAILGSLNKRGLTAEKKMAMTINAIKPVNLSKKTLAKDRDWELICLPNK